MFRLVVALVATTCCLEASPSPTRVGHVEVELLTEEQSIQPGKPFTVGLHLAAAEHWHTYWANPGDAGQATSILWMLPKGFTAGPIQWPTPERIVSGPVVNYGYEGDVLLLTQITPPEGLEDGASVQLMAEVSWLVCADQCIPGEATLALDVPVHASPAHPDPKVAPLFASARENLPVNGEAAWRASYSVSGDEVTMVVHHPADTMIDPADAYFFAAAEATIDPSQAQLATLVNGRLTVHMKKSDLCPDIPAPLVGVLVAGQSGVNRAIELKAIAGTAAGEAGGSATFLGAILSAFLGGMILNLMPCVFPVLGVKILGFVNQAGTDRRKIALHGLVFTAGVLLSFWTLAGVLIALRSGGEQLGWGFQLQSPAFVFGLSLFLLVFGMNLSGVFEFGLSATGVGGSLQMRSGYSGSFFTGVLVTVVSTPCAAPFLAPALGAALALPASHALVLFTVIALGLSMPYLVFSAFPSLVKALPRPGAWMESFKQFMAFPLYATVAFLIWVLAGQLEDDSLFTSLVGLVLVAMAAWAYGRWTQNLGSTARRRFGFGFAAVALVAGVALGWPRVDPAEIAWRPWSPETVASLQAEGKTVYVDFTARWCATCKVNKIAVFSSPKIRDAFVQNDVVPLKADWTNKDPEITRALAAFGRSAVPFNLIYAPGRTKPILLPEVLTPGVILDALAELKQTKVAAR